MENWENQGQTERSLRKELPNPALREPHAEQRALIAALDRKANVLKIRLQAGYEHFLTQEL